MAATSSSSAEAIPIGVRLKTDVEYRPNRPSPYRARVRWRDSEKKTRKSLSAAKESEDEAQEWLAGLVEAAEAGITPTLATMPLSDYGNANMELALRGLELKTRDPYLAGWKLRVVPALGHLPVRMITNGAVDRTVQNWIADEQSRSTVKNTIAVLVRVMEQAVRDNVIKINPARVTGRQKLYKQAEDELRNPRALALPDWGGAQPARRRPRRRIPRRVPRLRQRRPVRRVHRGTHRRSLRLPSRGHRHRKLDLDRPAADHPDPRRPGRQRNQG
ncbi:hypothetical protein ACGFRB_29235 [Streptomyces sp. NPDC048718]|uniref:hypothetical protein n=1 Tax=Streptomyces sp. NPDC048718 TaxID=3365587 RepID=UPI00371D3077